MTVRFIHSSDLHIGRRFANIPQPEDGNVRGRLMEARHAAIGALARAAQAHGARHVLLAGDTFDTPTPSPQVLRQALAAMGETADVTWWLLPGNHDNLRDAEPLWDEVERLAPANVRPLRYPDPVTMEDGATLLPCPVAWRAQAVDPTEPLVNMRSDDGALRIGLAHGGVTDFTESGGAIAPDRDRTARLDYLALGDWHGRMAVSPRVQYSGTPEQDRFKHGRRGVCLLVSLDTPGAAPAVQEIETGTFLWTEAELSLHAEQDIEAALQAALPATGRRDVLLRLRAGGWAGLAEQEALRRAALRAAPDFAFFDLVTHDVNTVYDVADLDRIDRAGALRTAADTLRAEAESEARSETDRRIARDALARLYSLVRRDDAE